MGRGVRRSRARAGRRAAEAACEAATEGQAVWRGTDALWVCDDAAV
jgi:hypothetical protein